MPTKLLLRLNINNSRSIGFGILLQVCLLGARDDDRDDDNADVI